MRKNELNEACRRRLTLLEEQTGRICRKLGVVVPPKGEKYVLGHFTRDRHRLLITIGLWSDAVNKFIPLY